MTKKVMFVCTGNICRSPLAKGLMVLKLRQVGKSRQYQVDCSGTSTRAAGLPPDPRTQQTARLHGFQLRYHSKPFQPTYFDDFDLILAMDRENRSRLMWLARSDRDRAKVHLLREFDPQAFGDLDVPDPYNEDLKGFEQLYQLLDRSISGLLQHLETPWVPPSA